MCVCMCGREKEKERDRQTNRERQKERESKSAREVLLNGLTPQLYCNFFFDPAYIKFVEF